MKRSDAKKHIEFIKAFAEGKTIQFKKMDGTWAEGEDLMFGLGYEYRIKPEPKLVPFTFKDAKELIGKKIFTQYSAGIISHIEKNSLCTGGTLITYDFLLKAYKFEDGSPCGKIVES